VGTVAEPRRHDSPAPTPSAPSEPHGEPGVSAIGYLSSEEVDDVE